MREQTMIERVARAQWDQRRKWAEREGYTLEEWGDGSIPRANGIEEEARAAVAAMRDLSEGMLDGGEDGVSRHYGGCCIPADNRKTARDVWQAAIDAALAEKSE